jgi:hypothetical protein
MFRPAGLLVTISFVRAHAALMYVGLLCFCQLRIELFNIVNHKYSDSYHAITLATRILTSHGHSS